MKVAYIALREFISALILIAVGFFAALVWKRK
jgi:hypothetical protein